jgi:hypothetical protein
MIHLTITDLENLTADEFDDELNEALTDMVTFRVFLEPQFLRQTAEYLNRLRDEVDGMLFKHKDDDDWDHSWEVRTKGFRGVVSSRLHMAQGRIRESEKQEAGSQTSASRQWKRFAHRLAELLDGYDENILETVQVPFGDLNAAQWLDRRIEKDPMRTGVNA